MMMQQAERIFKDFQGRTYRLTNERWAHVLSHPEHDDQALQRVEETIQAPDRVVRSRTDATVALWYRWYEQTPVTSKYLCVVVKVEAESPFIINRHHQAGRGAMAETRRGVTVYYDREADYLEVLFEQKPGYFRETEHDAVMERVDAEGNVIGFSILKASIPATHPVSVRLSA